VRLAAEGVSIRRIAVAVFGNTNTRSRVERILKTEANGRHEPIEPLDIDGLAGLDIFKAFFDRRVATIAAQGGSPSMNELRTLLEVQRQLQAWESVELANRLLA
jgi:hypothetical protein